MNKKHIINPTFKFSSVRELVEWASENYGESTAFSYREKDYSMRCLLFIVILSLTL